MWAENLIFFEPDEMQLKWFHYLNAMDDDKFEEYCLSYDDCKVCPCAIHRQNISTTSNICTRGMSEKQFRTYMCDADCYFGR